MKLPGWARRENQLGLGWLARSVTAIPLLAGITVPARFYSPLTRSASAAANGQNATETSEIALRNRIAGLLPSGAPMAETPKISTGMQSGRISTGARRPPRFSDTV